MPSDPRASTEPTLEELNAYVDHELDDSARVRVEEHLATCADCRTRVDGLRQTAHAVRALPMETPPRRFTVPEQRRQSWRWAPVGWLGGAAAALLVVVFGIQQLHGLTGSGNTAGSTAFNAAAPASKSAQSTAAGAGTQDRSALAQPATSFPNGATVVDPGNASRRLVLGTDAAKYSVNGTIRVQVIVEGSPTQSTDSGTQGLTLRLMRGSAGVVLHAPVGVSSWNGTPVFAASYDVRSLQLPDPRPGDYQLVATWVIGDGSGRVLQATVPITISAG